MRKDHFLKSYGMHRRLAFSVGKHRFTRLICAVSSAVILSLCFSGCGTNKADIRYGEDNKEISIAIIDPNVPASEGTAENNRYTQYIEKESGYKIKWYIFPSSDYNTKLNAMLASGEAPDMFFTYNTKFFKGLASDGLLLPLNDLIDNYSDEYKKYITENSHLEAWTKSEDGETYAFTCQRDISKQANYGIWIRKDWLDKLGLPMPTTDEELFEAAKAFKTLGSDVLPMVYNYWMWPSIYQAKEQYYIKDDGSGLEYGPTCDRYASALNMMKRCYEEGLFDKEFFVDNNAARQMEKWNTGKAGILFMNHSEKNTMTLIQNVPEADPRPVPPISTKYGENGYYQECPPDGFVMVNAEAKNPIGCMKFIDWMIGGGWERIKYGEEGVHFEYNDGVPISLVDSDTKKNEVSYASKYMLVQNDNFNLSWIPKMAAKDEFSKRLADLQYESLKAVCSVPYRRDLPYDPPVYSVQKAITEYETERDTIMLKVTTGGSEYDASWGLAESRAEWERVGGKEADEDATEWWKKNKNSLPTKGLSIDPEKAFE